MKYTALASERQRQILWDPRQPVSQEPNNKVIHVVRRLLLNRVARAWHTHERRARDPGGEGPAHRDRLAIAGTGRADQDEPPYAVRILDRDLRGDRAAHGVPNEHGIGDTERIHEGDRETGVSRVVVRNRRLIGKSEAAVVEC